MKDKTGRPFQMPSSQATGPGNPAPAAKGNQTAATTGSGTGDIASFLKAAEATRPGAGGGRLIFALDATLSRQPTWDRATHLQAEMFEETAKVGGLQVQLVYFRGHGECRASRFVRDARSLSELMVKIDCRGGQTQIRRVLSHSLTATREARVAALVYVGDAMEENVDELCALAGELGLLGTRIFLFQEGSDPAASRAFAEMARLSGGAHVRLDAAAAARLGELLRAVAAYAAGGMAALEADGGAAARLLLTQLR